MTTATLRSALLTAILAVGISFTTSCTVDQQAAFETGAGGSKTKKASVSTEAVTAQERRAAAKAEREKAKAEAETQKAKELAEKEVAERKEEERKKALALREEKEKAERESEEEKAKAAELAAKKKELEERKAAKIAAKKKAEEARAAREVADASSDRGSSRGGLFGGFGGSAKYRGSGHDIYVNNRLIALLNPSNAKIEIDLSEQKARIFRSSGGSKDLVIETNISTGKSGYSTPTGSFRIKEKLVAKRSTRYGRWLNSSGATVRADGDSSYRPSGATQFVGASMPYWMRVTGGIGMHIGYVPNYPASHGCIRVPAEIQPLIYSKVGIGTSVSIHH